MTGPNRIVVAGDWHGNTGWALQVIAQARELLASQAQRIIVHCGDFGIWPGQAGKDFVFQVSAALDQAGATLLFADGNHEDFGWLGHEKEKASSMAWGSGAPIPIGSGSAALGAQIRWLWRGFRWTWHGRTWLACGGGVSLDKVIRTEGKNWWAEEEITDVQEAAVIAGGHADVLISHDCPAGVRHSFPPPPSWWAPSDLARNDAHRERLQRIADAVQPSHLIHGHLHRAYSRTCDFGYGPVAVTGLDRDGEPGNYAVLDVRTMEWEGDG